MLYAVLPGKARVKPGGLGKTSFAQQSRVATLLKPCFNIHGKSLEALPGVAYPSFRDNCSTLNTKTGF